jgi:hypothetical protein
MLHVQKHQSCKHIDATLQHMCLPKWDSVEQPSVFPCFCCCEACVSPICHTCNPWVCGCWYCFQHIALYWVYGLCAILILNQSNTLCVCYVLQIFYRVLGIHYKPHVTLKDICLLHEGVIWLNASTKSHIAIANHSSTWMKNLVATTCQVESNGSCMKL